MINRLLSAIRDKLNEFIKLKDPVNFGNQDVVVLSNLVEQDGTLAFTTASSNNQSEHKVVVTLINVEEEKTFKEQKNYQKTTNDTIVNINPEIHVNLSVLFTAYSTSYNSALMLLSYVLGFFQLENRFTPQNTPPLDGIIEKANVTLETLSAEQNNHLWGYLGAKYMPSIVYRIKMLTIQEGQQTAEGLPITIIKENFKDNTN